MAVTYERLSENEIREALVQAPDWELHGNAIKQEFLFGDFDQAMGFVNKVAEIARQLDHHPNIGVYYNKVDLELTTHKAGGLTEEDFELAREIDKIVISDE